MNPSARIERLTGAAVRSMTPMGGAWRAELSDGSAVVAKTGPPGQTEAEAAGLRWLDVANGPAVPEVRAHDEQLLVTAHVPRGRMQDPVQFGRELATLHASGAAEFGSPPPGGPADARIGTAPMRNEPARHWPSWFAEYRVLPYLRRAADADSIRRSDAEAVERACDRIDELAGPAEPPARLHGDLWWGNVHPGTDGRVWLLDPAAHGGHRETDLAMLALFGAPGLDEALAGYDETAPLAPGWRQRVPLHQLFPLLVHAVLFGGGYGASAGAAARAALH